MNTQMSYLIGMILGNGTLQRNQSETTFLIDIPHKNIIDDLGHEVEVYVKASVEDIKNVIEPLVGNSIRMSQSRTSTTLSFSKSNEDYTTREILRIVGNGAHHTSMSMSNELFRMSHDEKTELMRGFADVTGYIRKSNIAFGRPGNHRVYIEIPGNWNLVVDVANMLKELNIPIQTIDFGHPNFRDSNKKKYDEGNRSYWKKEHQIKIWANEFLPIGFNIVHKRKALETYADELLLYKDEYATHKFYWELIPRRRKKPPHPSENDPSLPIGIRGKHFESWTDLARELGYHD